MKKKSETFERTKGFMRTHMCMFDDVFQNDEMSLFLFFVGIETHVQWAIKQFSLSLSLSMSLCLSDERNAPLKVIHRSDRIIPVVDAIMNFFFYWIKYDLSLPLIFPEAITYFAIHFKIAHVVCVRYAITDAVLAIQRKANAQCASTSVKSVFESVFDLGAQRWNTQ